MLNEWVVTNVTAGVLEIEVPRRVLGPRGTMVVAEPIPEGIRWLQGTRKVKLMPKPVVTELVFRTDSNPDSIRARVDGKRNKG